MDLQIIFFSFVCFKTLTLAAILRPKEMLVKVKSPEEANGKLYFLDFTALAEQYGYDAEEHEVITEDGYFLTIFRIPGSKLYPKKAGKPVILLEPGLFCTSHCFGLFNRSLAYYLVDNGYDVWVGNPRGTTYGRKHVNLSTDDPRFWNYSWHEIGFFDYTATIDYILQKTNKQTISYIGHSMGGTSLLVMLSERPEYNKKLNVAVAMAPSGYFVKQNIVRLISLRLIYSFKDSIDPTGASEFLPQSNLLLNLFDLCRKFNLEELCLLPALLGENRTLVNSDIVTSVANYFPAGASTKCVWHYCQLELNGGKFRKYDYGQDNIKYYGQYYPPDYNVHKITTNLIAIYSDNDIFCAKEDIEELARRMSTKLIIERVKYKQFTHLDYILATSVKELLHKRLLQMIWKYRE